MTGDTLDDWFDEDDGLEQAAKLIEATKVKGDPDAPAVWSTEEDGSEKALVITGDWTDGLIRDAKGHALFNQHNVTHALRECPDWDGVLAYNEFTGRKMLLAPIPGSRSPRAYFKPRELADSDILTATGWFNRNRFPRAYKSVIADAIDEVIIEYRYNPVRDYLETSATAWDGKPRMAGWLETYCGVSPADPMEAEYVREVAAKWMISAVARIMEPGCKADCVLILEGTQGAGKSTAAKILAGAEFFGDNLPPMHTREASSYVRGQWIIELAELANVSKAEVEIVKAFISRTEERFRPAYGRNEVTYLRQCVFIGSTNRTDYLRDDTGNRRFWPVAVNKVDTAGLMQVRDQLWGEAVAAYRSGATWWLSAAVEKIAQAEQKDRLLEDPWQSIVMEKVAGKNEVCVPEILADMSIETGRRDRAMSNRIVSILMQSGWTRAGKFTTGTWARQSRYVPLTGAGSAAVAPAPMVSELPFDLEPDIF